MTDWEKRARELAAALAADERAEEIAKAIEEHMRAHARPHPSALFIQQGLDEAQEIARSTIKKPEPKTREQEANEAHAWLDEHLAGHPPGQDRSIVERFYGYVKLIDLHAKALAELHASQREQALEDALRKLRDKCALGSYGRGLAERALEWKP